MGKYIIYKDGAYNFYTDVADGACYEEALTLEQVRQVVKDEYGKQGLQELQARLDRAHKTGCSGHDLTLDDCISTNCQGPDGEPMPPGEFIKRYLTLKSVEQQKGDSSG